MVPKLLTLTFSKRISRWVSLNSYYSSISCANSIQTTPETNQGQTFTTEFESKIQFLKNRLHPESLTQILDSTTDVNSSLKLFKWASLQKLFKHNTDTYYMILLKLGLAGNVEEMEGFCNEMIKDKCAGFGEALLRLLDCFLENRKLDEALRVLFCVCSTSFKPNLGVFNELMGALVEENRDFKDVLFVYKEMVKAGIIPNVNTVNYLMEALFAAGRVEAALDQYRRMNKKGCEPNSRTFEVLVSGLIASDRVDESLLLLDEMFKVGCQLDLQFYTRIVPLLCRMNYLQLAMKLFKMMRAARLSPFSITYSVLVKCLCQHFRFHDAINLVDEMMDSDLIPDDKLFVFIVKGLCNLDKLDEANNFLKVRNIVKTCTYNVLVGAYCTSGKFRVAKDLFDDMFDRNITDRQSWNTLIRYLCERARVKEAIAFLCRMIVSSFVPDSLTYSALVIGKCKVGQSEDAFMFFRRVLGNSWVLDSVAYADLVASLCLRGNIQEAGEVFCYMSSMQCSLQSSSFDMLVKGICETGMANYAIKLLSLAHYSGTCWSCESYKSILRVLSESGNANQLFVLLSRMVVSGCSLDGEIYGILLRKSVDTGHTDECALYFELMLHEGLLPDSETLANLESLFAKHSQPHVLFSTIDRHVSKCEILDTATYNLLINGLWKEGYKTKASQLLDKMLEEGKVPDATTHALLMGYGVRETAKTAQLPSDDLILQDNVCSILEEGLGEM